MLRNYKELKVWEKSYRLCLEVYRITKGFPKIEIFREQTLETLTP